MAEFKVDMHHLYIRSRKDPLRAWVTLPFIATDDAIYEVLATWPPEWHAPDKAILEKMAAQQREKERQQRLNQLAEKTR